MATNNYTQLSAQIAAAAAFDPLSLGNLNLWLEVGDYNNIYAHEAVTVDNPCEDGEVCLGWQDRSGLARHGTEATNGPTYQLPTTSDSGQPNGQGRLEMDGTNDLLTIGSAADNKNLHDGTGMTVYCVVKTVANVNCPILDTTNALAGIGFCLFNDDDSGTGRASVSIRDGSGSIATGQAPTTSNVCPADEWHLWCAQWVPGVGVDLYLDDCFILRAALAGTPSTDSAALALKIGTGFSGDLFVPNHYNAILHYRALHTAAQRRQVSLYLGVKNGLAIGNVACLGDSITSGAAHTATTYPEALATQLGPLYRVANFGVSGAVVNTTPGNDVYNDQWIAQVKAKRFNNVVSLAGVGDLINTSDSAATIMERYDDVLDGVLAQPDTNLVLCTVMPIQGTNGYDETMQARLDAFNVLLRSYSDAHPRCYFLDTYDKFGSPTNRLALNPLFNQDNLHPNQTGTYALAALVADKMIEISLAA